MTSCKQRREPCGTCPWMVSILGDCFSPATLEKTVVADYLGDRAQTCHSNHDFYCAGALAFAKRNGDIFANASVRMGFMAGILTEDMIDTDLETFDSIEEMLESHGQRMRYN